MIRPGGRGPRAAAREAAATSAPRAFPEAAFAIAVACAYRHEGGRPRRPGGTRPPAGPRSPHAAAGQCDARRDAELADVCHPLRRWIVIGSRPTAWSNSGHSRRAPCRRSRL